jgi:NAD(P)H-hydrate epimerase
MMVSLRSLAAKALSTTTLLHTSSYWTRRSILSFCWSAVASSSFSSFPRVARAQATQKHHQRNTNHLHIMSPSSAADTGYLAAKDAAALDAELMTAPGFTLEQLMELAGLAVAEAVYEVLRDDEKPHHQQQKQKQQHVLVLCGPGNNGGDGLVAARHLVLFGFAATVVYPTKERSMQKQPHYANLVKQCEDFGIPILTEMPDNWIASGKYTAVMDALFGFSFSGTPRPPFDTILDQVQGAGEKGILTVAVDIASGWNVDDETAGEQHPFQPDVLVSLTTPKLCARNYAGRHFVGGRFLVSSAARTSS